MIPLSKPSINNDDLKAVETVLRSGRLSLGPVVGQFEAALAKVAGVQYAVCVNSGSSALELIVNVLDLGEHDEVICPSFSFIATANCLVRNRVTPVFAEIDPNTYCVDPASVEALITRRTRAIIGVDLFGQCVNWTALQSIAEQYGLLLIEDACEAIGASHADRPAGSFGEAACFSFYPNKQMTTGEGGVVLTNNPYLATHCRALRNQGRIGDDWLAHAFIGMNYRMTELQAALGLSQLSRLADLLAQRQWVAQWYEHGLRDLPSIVAPVANLTTSWFVYVIRVLPPHDRDTLLRDLAAEGVESRAYFPPIHLQPAYQRQFGTRAGHLPITESIACQTLALPFHAELSEAEVQQVCAAVRASVSAQIRS